MRNYTGQTVTMKLSDFFVNESGKVGVKSAFVMGATVSAAAIAQMMFATGSALAHSACTSGSDCVFCCCSFSQVEVPHKHCTTASDCTNLYGGSCI